MTVTTGSPGTLDWLASLLGLTNGELRAYQFLHRTGGAAAGSVAKEVGLARGRIYDLLRGLVERGLVRELPGPRIHYVPVPIREVISALKLHTSHQLQLLEEATERLPEQGQAQAPASPRTRPGDVSVLHGRRAVEAETRRLLDATHRRFLLAGTRYLAPRLAGQPATLAALGAARRRGVELEVFLPDAADEVGLRSSIVGAVGEEHVRLLPLDLLPPITYAIADGVALMTVVQPLDGEPMRGDDVGIRIEGRAMVDAVRQRFEQLSAGLASTAPGGIAQAYARALGHVQREVVAMGPREWPRVLEAASSRLREPLEAAQERGVAFRALTEDTRGDRSRIEALSALWQVRTMPAVPVWIAVFDETEVLQAFPSGTGPLKVRSSRDPAEVRYWLEWFERWWLEARPTPVVRA